MNSFITSAQATITSTFTAATESQLFTQLRDATTETGHALVATTSATAGTLLVTATATRMATQGLASFTPKTKEEASAMILSALTAGKNLMDTATKDNTPPKTEESVQSTEKEESDK